MRNTLMAAAVMLNLAAPASAQTRELVAPWTVCGYTACIKGSWSFHPGPNNGQGDIFTKSDGRSVTIWRQSRRQAFNWEVDLATSAKMFVLGGAFAEYAVTGGTAYNGLVGSLANPDAVQIIITPEVSLETRWGILESLSWCR